MYFCENYVACCLFSRVEDAIIGLEKEACRLVQQLALGKMLPNAASFGMTVCISLGFCIMIESGDTYS